MFGKPLEELTEFDISRLIKNSVSEDRHIEFKRELPGNSDEEIKKFLASVSSFANAQGGDLLYGVDAPDGLAIAIPGIQIENVDAENLKIESRLRDSIAPRIGDVRIQWIPLAEGNQILVMRIPASLSAPHRVEFRKSGKFFSRNNAGKFPMDVHDLRHAFTEVGSLPERFRSLHNEAKARARGEDVPLSIEDKPTAVVSLMPLGLFREELNLSVTRNRAVQPVKSSGHSAIDMIEGVMMHTPVQEGNLTVRSFAISYRTGRVDVAWNIGDTCATNTGKISLVYNKSFEEGLFESVMAAQSHLRSFGVEGPWVLFVSVIGARAHCLRLCDGELSEPAYKSDALLGNIKSELLSETDLSPAIDNFWLLFGVRRIPQT